MSVNGLVVMTPTSIASTGTGNSSSIGANGKVTFSSCATLSLNGVFTSSYDNYMIVVRNSGSTDASTPLFYLRASGTNSSTNFTHQRLLANSTTISGSRSSSAPFIPNDDSQRNGSTTYLFGPQLSQATAGRIVCVSGLDNARVDDIAFTHSTASSYDGFTLDTTTTITMTGEVTVYGFNQ